MIVTRVLPNSWCERTRIFFPRTTSTSPRRAHAVFGRTFLSHRPDPMLYSLELPGSGAPRIIESGSHADALDAIAKEVAATLLLDHVYGSRTPYKALMSYMRTPADVGKKEFVAFALQSARIVQSSKHSKSRIFPKLAPSSISRQRAPKRRIEVECLEEELGRMHIRKGLTVRVPDDESSNDPGQWRDALA